MQSAPSTIGTCSWRTCYFYPVPRHIFAQYLNSNPAKVKCAISRFLPLGETNSYRKRQEKRRNTRFKDQENHRSCQDFYSFYRIPETDSEEKIESGIATYCDFPSNMWWADLKAVVGQRINLEGIACSVGILGKDRHLVMPHVTVSDIRYIDWAKLKNSGFKGVVFDKDNTITIPYSLSLWAPLRSSIELCKSLFGDNIAVFSNSAGLYEYDPDGRKARALEDAIGIKVILHKGKKPGGTAEEIEEHFGCEATQLIMVGDRPFTDVAFGNRHGLFTILTAPLSHTEEPLIVRQVRLFEMAIVGRWSKEGLKPTSHKLLPDAMSCVNDVPTDSV